MNNIRSTATMFIDDIFEMNSGYVLNFLRPNIAQFFCLKGRRLRGR